MNEYTTYRNDYGIPPKKRKKKLKPIYKKIKPDKLYLLVKEYILNFKDIRDKKDRIKKEEEKPNVMQVYDYQANYICAEKVAEHFQVKKHEIKEVFKKLNQEGILSQGENSPPHDCRRATTWMDAGSDDSWKATAYRIL